jgi:hypothetical protein
VGARQPERSRRRLGVDGGVDHVWCARLAQRRGELVLKVQRQPVEAQREHLAAAHGLPAEAGDGVADEPGELGRVAGGVLGRLELAHRFAGVDGVLGELAAGALLAVLGVLPALVELDAQLLIALVVQQALLGPLRLGEQPLGSLLDDLLRRAGHGDGDAQLLKDGAVLAQQHIDN